MKLRNLYIIACLLLSAANIYANQPVANRPERCALNDTKDKVISFTKTGCDWGRLIYHSSAPSIVDINPDTAVIRARGLGIAIITVTMEAKGCTGDGQKYSCEINVVDDQPLPEMTSVTKILGDPPFMLEYSADIDNNFIYTSSNEAVATISGKQVTIRGVGETTITARKKESLLLNGRPKLVTSTLTVRPAHQEITYTGATACTYGEECIAQATTAQGGIVNFESDTPDICTVTEEGAILVKKNEMGVCHIRARQNGHADYKTQAIVINASTLSLGDLPHGTYKTRYSEELTATGGYGTYHYQVTSGILPAGLQLIKECGEWKLSGMLEATPGFVYLTLTATDENQVSTNRSYSFYIKKAELIISNLHEQGNHSLSVPYGRSHTVEKMPYVWINKVADNNSLSMLKYESTNPGICSVENNNGALTIKGNGVGQAQIIASLKKSYQSDYFCPADYCPLGDQQQQKAVVYTCQVTPIKQTQTIHFSRTPATCTYGAPCYVTATSDANLAVRYSVSKADLSGRCEVDSTTGAVTIKKNEDGHCIIKASQAGNAHYLAAEDKKWHIAVSANNQRLMSDLEDATYETPYSQTLTTTGGYAPYTYVLHPADRSLDGLVLKENGILEGIPGRPRTTILTVIVTDVNGVKMTRQYKLKINRAPSYIKFSDSSVSLDYGKAKEMTAYPVDEKGDRRLTYPDRLSHSNIHYHSDDANICQVTNEGKMPMGLVRATGVGRTKITATIKGNEYYEDGTASYNCIANQASQVVAYQNFTTCTYGQPCKVNWNASGGEVRFASNTTDICTVTAQGDITQKRVGTCIISAHQSGNAHYLPFNGIQKIEMIAAKPSISNLGNLTVTYARNKTISLNLKSTSPGKLSYESSNPRVATVNQQGLITILDGTGGTPITITVRQAAAGLYAALKETITLTVKQRDSELKQIYGKGQIVLTDEE